VDLESIFDTSECLAAAAQALSKEGVGWDNVRHGEFKDIIINGCSFKPVGLGGGGLFLNDLGRCEVGTSSSIYGSAHCNCDSSQNNICLCKEEEEGPYSAITSETCEQATLVLKVSLTPVSAAWKQPKHCQNRWAGM
jgi:hypothetical protein